ncbi:MAG: hypothetical protein APR53_03010 [Methanoculleus sp. SDB]|nr:MAG: hypothetical protein APR53_03010 [Methanoculleus sp. SDB]
MIPSLTTVSLRQLLPVCVACIIAALVFIPAAVSADTYVGGIPLTTEKIGTVSGGLWFNSLYGTAGQPVGQPNTVTMTFLLPEHSEIRWARIYVAVYCGHMQNNYEGTARVKLDGNGDGSFERTLGTETLNVEYSFPGEGGVGAVAVNDHCNRVTSDYLMWYDVTENIHGGTVGVEVFTDKNPGYTGFFDGRIKLITLVVAYDDGDADEVQYWVNQGHDVDTYYSDDYLGEDYIGECIFSAGSLPNDWESSELSVVYLASENGNYNFNLDDLGAASPQGGYAGSQTWDVTDSVAGSGDNILTYSRSLQFYKIPLAMLTISYQGAQKGSLSVTSSPAGAAILLDDEETGQATNATLGELPAGDHVVTVAMEGYYEPDEVLVTVEAGGTTTVHFTLEPIIGSIHVDSDPAGADIYLDAVQQDEKTGATLEGVVIGEHTVMVRKSGYTDASETVFVEEGETAEVSFELSPVASRSAGDASADRPGYSGTALALYRTDTLCGGVSLVNVSGYSGLLKPEETREYTFPVTVPSSGTIEVGRLFIYSAQGHNTETRSGVIPHIQVSVNGKSTPAASRYTDQKDEEEYEYILATDCFDLTDSLNAPGEIRITVRNAGTGDETFALHGAVLAVVYRDENSPRITYWLYEGCDAILASPEFGTTSESATTTVSISDTINTSAICSARLIAIASAASGTETGENLVSFNGWEWFNLLRGDSSGISRADLDVKPYLSRSDNIVAIRSYNTGTQGDYLESRNIFLVLNQEDEGAPPVDTLNQSAAGTVPQDRTQTGGSDTHRMAYALSLANGGTAAQYIVLPDGSLTLYIREGTEIRDSTGGMIGTLGISRPEPGSAGAGNATGWIYRISPDDAMSDIPMVLTAPVNASGHEDVPGDSLSFARYNPGTGLQEWIATTYDKESGVLSCEITRAGVYALYGGEAGAPGDADKSGLSGNPLFSMLMAVWNSLFGSLFGPSPAQDNGVGVLPPDVAGVLSELVIETAETTENSTSALYSLSIRSNPPGALIFLDGTYLGKTTPATTGPLEAGEYRIRLDLEGFRPAEQDIILTEDTCIDLDLSPRDGPYLNRLKYDMIDQIPEVSVVGGVRVESVPSGAEIYIDSRNVGFTTPKVIYGLKEGIHTIKVKKAGALVEEGKLVAWTASESVWIYPDAITPVQFLQGVPVPPVRTVTIDSDDYSGKMFSICGKYPAGIIPQDMQIRETNPFITIENDGTYQSYRLDNAEDGTSMKIQPESQDFGAISVESVPSGADIFLDGFPTGYCTPYSIGNVSEGPHSIMVSKLGYLPAENDLWLVPGHADADAAVRFILDSYSYGSIWVNSTPAGAKIYLYGRDTGAITPYLFSFLEIGTYDLKLKRDRASESIEGILVSPYELRRLAVNITDQ